MIPAEHTWNSSNSNVSTENKEQFLELIFSTDRPKSLNLEIKKVDGQALYEEDTNNEKNVKERSFILIDQRYRVPLLNQLYNRLQAQKGYLENKNYKTFVSNDDSDSKYYGMLQNLPIFNKPVPFKNNGDKKIEDVRVEYYEPPKRANYKVAKKNAIVDELNNLKIKVQEANRAIGHQYRDKRKKNNENKQLKTKGVVNERLEYLELLKPPLIRTGANAASARIAGTTDEDYDNKPSPKDNPKMISPAYPTMKTQIKTVKGDNYKSKSFPVLRDHFKDNNIAWKLEEMNMNSDSQSDDNVYRALDEDREVFDNFIETKSSDKEEKRNINKNTKNKNSVHGNNLCLFPGCITEHSKPVKAHEANCKCDVNFNEYLKSDINDRLEVAPAQYSEKDLDDNMNI